MHSSQLIAPAHRSFIRIVAGTSDTHRFFYRVTNTRSRNRHIFRKLIRDNSPREHLSLSLFSPASDEDKRSFQFTETRKNIRAILRHARHPRFYPRAFHSFVRGHCCLGKKKKKKRKTINKVSQREIEFFRARRSVILARGETFFPFVHTNLRLFPTDARSLFWILPRFSPLHDRAEYLYIKGIVSP